MRVGSMRAELFLPGAQSLKEKRRPLRSLIARLTQKFNASVAEVGGQDLHQRATLGIALVAVDGKHLHTQMNAIREFLHQDPELQVLAIHDESWGGDGA